jgi:unsaturated chondroitin disaccharide hydrolase
VATAGRIVTTYPVLPTQLPLVPPAGVALPEDWDTRVSRAFQTGAAKVSALVHDHPDRFPLYTTDGKWNVDGESWTNWCEGFLGGQLWLLADRFGGDFGEQAVRYSKLIEHRQHDREVHDLGFLFWSTWRRWYEHSHDPAQDAVVVEAGRTLALRFNEPGRYLRSFLAADSLFIDIMMNVGIIFYAAGRTEDPELARIAYEHCLTSRRYLVRGDGSASHEGIFDPVTGQFLRQSTQQGWRDDGSWARGQSWALYGFATAYRHTGDRRFLATAQACADFYIEHTGDSLVPPNDWAEPHPTQTWESSAAAVAAGGIWQLACLVQDATVAARYGDYAVAITSRLCDAEFLAADDASWEGVLKHGSYHESRGLGVNESVMWGDYWFLDALDTIDRSTRPVSELAHHDARRQHQRPAALVGSVVSS